MAQDLDININVKTQGADTPIKSIREQIKQATRDVVEFSNKFGATSTEAVNAAKKVAELRDRIGDAKSLSDAFNPDAKFKALTASLSGVAGGFGAVQGAMALFGNESENVQKTLLKVQSAMAISQGLQSVGESIDSFRQLGAVIKSTSVYQAAYNFIMGDAVEVAQEAVVSIEAETVALSSEAAATVAVTTATTAATIAMRIFRAALIATGIGAVVVLVGLLIEALGSLTSSTKDAKDAQDKLNESIATQNEILDSNITKIKRAGELRISELKKNGATEAEIYKEQRINDTLLLDEYLKNKEKKYNLYQEELKKNGKSTDKEILANLDKFRKEAISADNQYEDQKLKLQVDANNEILRVNKIAADKKKAQNDKAAEKEKERLQKVDADAKAYQDFEIKRQQDANEREEEAAAKKEEKRLKEEERNAASMKATTDFEVQLANDLLSLQEQKLQNEKEYNAQILEAEYQLQDAKFSAVSAGLDMLGALAGKNEALANAIFVVDKAMAIAKVVVDTQREIAGYRANPTWSLLPDGGAVIKTANTTAARIRAGISIATIAATSIAKYKNGSGSGGASVPSVSSAAPMMPQLPSATTTNISQQSINDIGNQAVRAYVIESDVTSNQQRIAAIRQRARFS